MLVSLPDAVRWIRDELHEIGAHGLCHESPIALSPEEETGLLQFRCNGGRAKRANSAHPPRDILGECLLPSYFQRTVTTRPAESERELALVNPVCHLQRW
jgi:hypothetical protein